MCDAMTRDPLLQVTDTSKALGECLRVLKRGGRFMCVRAPHVQQRQHVT